MNVAILGFGTVGVGVYELLEKTPGLSPGPVLVRAGKVDAPYKTDDLERIVSDPEVWAVCECMGGVEPAFSYAAAVLKAGKHLVTSNKALVAARGPELAALAEESGAGFLFSQKITGGAVPKQWIPAVEQGVRDALEKGPLGFPVIDVEVTLVDGAYHSVDSSEMSFRAAGRLAMGEGLQSCGSCLMEPIEKLDIYSPSACTSKITSALSGRRGQILGFGPRDGWPGWDRIEAHLPQAERRDLIAELRSLTQGLATFETGFAHMAEVHGRLADEITQKARTAA